MLIDFILFVCIVPRGCTHYSSRHTARLAKASSNAPSVPFARLMRPLQPESANNGVRCRSRRQRNVSESIAPAKCRVVSSQTTLCTAELHAKCRPLYGRTPLIVRFMIVGTCLNSVPSEPIDIKDAFLSLLLCNSSKATMIARGQHFELGLGRCRDIDVSRCRAMIKDKRASFDRFRAVSSWFF